jgi:hypothetical protein
MGCTVLEFHLAADILPASQLRSEGIPLVIFDLLNLIVYPNLYRRSGAHIAKAVISGLSVMGGADDAGGASQRLLTSLSTFAASLPTEVPSKPP